MTIGPFLRGLVMLLSGLALMVAAALAQADAPGSAVLAGPIEMLPDPGGTWNAGEVLAQPDGNWQRVASEVLPLGYRTGTWWVRWQLRNAGQRPAQRLLEVGWPLLDWLDVDLVDEKGAVQQHWCTGDQRPVATRPWPGQDFAFPVELPPGQSRLVLLRLALRDGVFDMIPLRLWQPEAFVASQQSLLLWQGLYFGAILAILVYNGLLYYGTRDRNFLDYVVYLGLVAFWAFGYRGFGYLHAWPDAPWINNLLNLVVPVAAVVAATRFAQGFLETRQRAPGLHALLLAITGLMLVPAAGSLMDLLGHDVPVRPIFQLHVALVLANSLLQIATGIVVYRRGLRAARYFLWAWACLGLGVAVFLLASVDNGVLPFNAWTRNAVNIGSALEFLLLALGLGDRYRQLRERNQQMEAEAYRMQIRQHVFATVAHEIRTPLTVIHSAVHNLLLMAEPLQPATRRRFERIRGASQRLMTLFDEAAGPDLLGSDRGISRQPCDPRQLLEDAAGAAWLVSGDHVVVVDTSGLPSVCHCDPGLTRLALRNLADNAVKYTPAGTRIDFRGGQDPQGVWLAVADQGPGLAPELLERLFEPGFRGGGDMPGTGLGLTLARFMAEQQGGTLTASSQPGMGCCFILRLPQRNR